MKLWKESKRDGPQFHQYQQNEQSPLNNDGQHFHQLQRTTTSRLKPLNIKKAMTYGNGNPGPGLGQTMFAIIDRDT